MTEEEKKQRQAESHRKWYRKNRERILEQQKQYHEQHHDEYVQRSKQWQKDNPERARKLAREHYHRDIEKSRERVRELARQRRATPGGRAADTAAERKHRFSSRYGITVEQYEEMHKAQNGLCAVCQTPGGFFSNGDRLTVDHDHATGKVRGLICGNCNVGLGHFKDDVERIQRAIDYLREKQ